MTKQLAIAAALAAALASTSAHAADAAGDLELGVARVQAGQYAAAIAPLLAAHDADPSDLDTTLLLGIAYYRCGDVARARPLLAAAARSPDPETRDGARIILGMLAASAGETDAAIGYYDSVAHSASSFAASGAQLLGRERGERFAAALVIRPELDSNVAVLPTAVAPTDGSASDRDLLLLAELHVRPFDAFGLVLDETASYRKQAELTDYDAASSVSGLTWREPLAGVHALLGYHVDASTLGGERFQLGQTVDAGLRRTMTGGFGAGASYQVIIRTLYPEAYAGYSGIVQTGAAKLSWVGRALEIEGAGIVARESTEDATLAALAAGGQLAARLRLGRIDVRMSGRVMDRRYDAAAMGRRDLQLRGEAGLYVELMANLGAVLGATLLDDRSNVMEDSYVKWTGYLGIVVATAP